MAKIIRTSSFFACCFGCLFFLADLGTSYANVVCNVKIESAIMNPGAGGADSSGVLVNLRNTTGATIPGTNWANGAVRGFYLYRTLGDQGLAIALTALSTKTEVRANIAGTAAAGSLIMSIGVTQTPQ